MWAFNYVDPNYSIDKMKQEKMDPAKQISPYILKGLDDQMKLTGLIGAQFLNKIKQEVGIDKAEDSKIKKLEDAASLEFQEGAAMTKLKDG